MVTIGAKSNNSVEFFRSSHSMLVQRLWHNGMMEIPRPVTSAVRQATVARMRQLLEKHLGKPCSDSDHDVAELCATVMRVVVLLRSMPAPNRTTEESGDIHIQLHKYDPTITPGDVPAQVERSGGPPATINPRPGAGAA